MMKVLLVNDLPEQGWKSMNRYAVEVFCQLSSIQSLEVELAWPTDTESAYRRIRKPYRKYVRYPINLLTTKADIIHILDHSYAFLAWFTGSTPTVVTCHDLSGLQRWKGNRIAKLLWRYLGIPGLKRADLIIADSESTKEDVIKLLGYNRERVIVNHLGANEHFVPQDDRFRLRKKLLRRLRLPESDGTRLILHVGSNSWRKNIEGLLRVLRILRIESNVDAHFIKVGDDFTDSQWNIIRNLGLNSAVHIMRDISDKELVEIYNACDVLVFPSYLEGFGFPVLEAMACGLPVVCSNTTSLREIADGAAITVAPHDVDTMAQAVLEVLTNRELWIKLREKGLSKAKNYTWGKHAKRLIEIYQEVRDAHRHRHSL